MSPIEELPDDFDESMNLNAQPQSQQTSQDTMLDDWYDRAVARGGLTDKTFEEALADLSKTPLFMTSLDQVDGDSGENDMIEALKALQYEGTKAEIAQGFKERGNESIQEKQWKDAREFYTKGIAVLLNTDKQKWETADDMEEENTKRRLLTEQLYVNRARCNLELKNYRSTMLDCAAALKINPLNIKAHYRSASALFALDKVYEALDVCYRGFKLDPPNVAMKTLLSKIQQRSKIKQDVDRKRRAERERKRKERVMLATALKARNIRIRASGKPPDMADVAIRLAPDPLSPTSLLEFPAMFLYPTHNQSDFVKAFAEKDTIHSHLSYILPPPWDTKGEYKANSVECYMDTANGGLMKTGKKISLLEVLSDDKVEILDGLIRLYVVPRALAPIWLEDVKRKKGR